jgi:hypothetical protein
MGLAYASEAEDRVDRLTRKLRKRWSGVMKRAGGTNQEGMHWRTFDALCERIAAAEEEKDSAWFKGAARLLARWGTLAVDDRS